MAQAQDETPDKRTPVQISKYWQEQLELAKKDRQNFLDDGKKVVKRFKSGRDALRSKTKRLNILYSNTEVLRASLYGKSAKPDVRRRFGMEDKAAGSVASILEKALVYCAEAYNSDKQIELGVLDYLLPGRGVVRIEYEPTISADPVTGQQFITDQRVEEKYWHWQDFLHMPARTWDDILTNGWVSFAHRMTRAELVENFGDVGNEAPLNWMPDIVDKKDAPDSLKKAEVFEIWDVNDRKRYWIVEGFEKPLRVDPDPYGLEQFFPLPEPPAYYATTDSIIPEPEFHIYQDQADDLDEITARISRLTRALKRRGVYDQSVKELSKLANAADNQFIAVENYQALATKGGLQAAFQSEDISIIATVLLQLYQQKDMLVSAIWELCGISDIMRGQTQASETLGAQQLKAQFGSQRLKRRQRAVQKWVADLLKLKAEIIAEHFQPEVLQQMTGEQITPDIMQILRSDKLRAYRIDVETDSTVFEDAEEERNTRAALVTAVSQFITAWGPIVGASPPLAPVAFELLKFGLGAFKATRGIEDAIEQAQGMLEQEAAVKKAKGPEPSPEEKKMMLEAQQADKAHQLETAKAQNDAQLKREEMQSKTENERQKAMIDIEVKKAELQIKREELDLKRQEMQMKAQMDRESAQQDAKLKEKDHALKVQDFVSKEHERHVQKTERDRQFGHEQFKAVGEDARAERAEVRADKENDRAEDADAVGKAMPEAAKSIIEATKALPQVAKAIATSTERLAEVVDKVSKPRRRRAIRDDKGDIVETVEEAIE